MVQNKQLAKDTMENGDEIEEALGSTSKLLNGTHDEASEESEEEDDYLQYLTVVPQLDASVEGRNMSLISQSLLNFYTAIQSRKEYPRIKQELMESYVPNDCKDDGKLQETLEVKLEETEAINSDPPKIEQINEVTQEYEAEAIETKQCTLRIHKAPFGKT